MSVGNAHQPFDRLMTAVAHCAARLPSPILVQCGHSKACLAGSVENVDFMTKDDFRAAIEAASLVVMHGGAGSIIDACSAGKIPVVMPRLAAFAEIIDDHQVSYAKRLQDEGVLVMCEDEWGLPAAASRAMEMQGGGRRAAPRGSSLVNAIAVVLRDFESQRHRRSA